MRTLDLKTLRLEAGAHNAGSRFCLLEAVAYVAGEPWSASPRSTGPVLAAYGTTLNDLMPNKVRQRLVPYIMRLIGAAGTPEVERQRAFLAVDRACRTFAPRALRSAGLGDHARALEALDPVTDAETAAMAYGAATEVVVRAYEAVPGIATSTARVLFVAASAASAADEAARAIGRAGEAAPAVVLAAVASARAVKATRANWREAFGLFDDMLAVR